MTSKAVLKPVLTSEAARLMGHCPLVMESIQGLHVHFVLCVADHCQAFSRHGVANLTRAQTPRRGGPCRTHSHSLYTLTQAINRRARARERERERENTYITRWIRRSTSAALSRDDRPDCDRPTKPWATFWLRWTTTLAIYGREERVREGTGKGG